MILHAAQLRSIVTLSNVRHSLYFMRSIRKINLSMQTFWGNVYGYNPTTEWSATLSAGDAPQRNAPGRTDSPRVLSDGSTIIRRWPIVSPTRAAIASRPD